MDVRCLGTLGTKMDAGGGLGGGGGFGEGGGDGGAGGDGGGGGGGFPTQAMMGVGAPAPAALKLKPPCSSPCLPRFTTNAFRPGRRLKSTPQARWISTAEGP